MQSPFFRFSRSLSFSALAAGLSSLSLLSACSDSGSGPVVGTGGTAGGSGGQTPSGGAGPAGGAGAVVGTGGSPTSGGTPGVGGSVSTGGGVPGGGAPPTGGAPSGGAASGGAPSGGAPSGGSGGSSGGGATGGSGGGFTSDCVPEGRARNPLVTQIFTADPNAIVYGDRLYVYTSHDEDGQDGFDMVDYHAFSTVDLVNWQDHGVLIHANELSWADRLYAPGACERDGTYYMYIPNSGSAVGVAVSDNPGGPFVDPLKNALITPSFPNANVPWLFDPACFIDDDGQAYLYFGGGSDGGQNARVVRLNDDMISLMDASATTIPTTAFFEASFMHKRDGKYYFSYSSDFSAGHGANLEYLMSDSPMSGFEYMGIFLANHSINDGNNNHGSIVDYMGKTYLFYHNRKLQQELGVNKVNNRSVAFQEITYAADGTLNPVTMSTEDRTVDQLKCLDAFSEVEAETLAAENGIEVEGRAGETVRIAQIGNGDWIGYSQVDFRNGATALVLQVASAGGGGTIDVRIDGCGDFTDQPGTSIGTCEVQDTGGNGTFAELSCPITETTGGHDLCLSFSDNPSFEIDSFHIE